MEIRKFIVELHPDGKMTWCEYEDPADVIDKEKHSAWLSGYRQALVHLDIQVEDLRKIKDRSPESYRVYATVSHARDEIAAWYHRYTNGQ